jgi:hypothetical protein
MSNEKSSTKTFFTFKIYAMKNLILILITLFLGYDIQANHFENGTHVYVTAPSGLNMRTSPDTEGRVIYYLEYGDYVTITEYESTSHTQRIDWIDGNWVKVNYEGVEGYVFDGYLSTFPVPKYDYELYTGESDLIYPIESYFSHHFGQTSSTDTLINMESNLKVVHKLDGNKRIIKTQKPGIYKLEVYVENVRIMDVYNLLYGMFTEKYEKEKFNNNSLFIEDYDGFLEKIKVGIDSPIEIKKLKNGQIKITAYSYYDGC